MLKRTISLTLGLIIASIPIANAHTALVSTHPKSNAMLKSSPKYISLTFNQDLIEIAGKKVNQIRLFNSKNKEIKLTQSIVIGKDIHVPVSKLPASKYKVTYRVVSADGHPITGSFNFWVH